MSLPVLIAFAGVLVAAVATGMLAGRCVRQPRIGFIVWAAATLGLTIALAAQSMGFASGFGPATFRASSLFALLLAPLWLSWGLVEVAVASEGARFGVRLISSALTVVATVILATDPLTAQPFSKAWPLTGTHFQPVARDALAVVQAFAIVVAVVTAGLAAIRASRGSGPPVKAVIPVALAVLMTAGQRLPLPADAVYPLLSMLAAVLVWFAVSRVGQPSRRAAARDQGSGGRGEGVRDASDKPGDDYWPDDRPAGGYVPEGQYVTYGQDRPRPARPRGGFPGGPATGGPAVRGPAARAVPDGDRGRRPGPPPRPPERPDRYRGSGAGESLQLATDERAAATQPVPAPGPEAGAAESVLPPSTAGAAAVASAAAARPYGRILIFTLLEDRAADFDRLAEETAEQVRIGEPDTLVYVIHLVPNAPLQRIFYEIYRDRAAFDSHESQPYMERFVTERRTCVLATNMIELRLKYAKVAPLPSPQPAAAAPGSAPPPPGPPRYSGPQGSYGSQRPRPLPPARPQRTDQPRYAERYDERYDQPGYDQPGYDPPGYDQPRYDQPRYDPPRADRERCDERRPDQRQVPSGRPYGG
jgi:quinol monooxygenase YgiN